MAGNMKFHKLTLTLLMIFCLGLLLISAPPVAARVPVSEQWVRTYGYSGGPDAAMAVTTDRLGCVYVTGGSYDPAKEQTAYATVKYNPAGEQLWVARFYSRYFDYALPEAIDVDDQGNVYVTGTAYSFPNFRAFITVMYSPDGQELGVGGEDFARYGIGDYDKPAAQAVDSSGVYITGTMHMVPGAGVGDGGRIYTYKYGDDGWWSNIKGTGSEDYRAIAMTLDNDGNIIVTGVNRVTNEYITIKYNNHCQPTWERTYAAGLGTNPSAVAVDADNNIYVFGYSMDGTRSSSCTLKYDKDGTLQWRQRYDPGHQNLLSAMDMKVDATGNVYATGYADSARSAAEYYTIKYNTDGVLQWTTRYAGTGQAPNYALKLGLDRFANVYVTGTWGDPQSGSSAIATVSYDPAGVLRWEKTMEGRTGRPIPTTLPKEKGKVSRSPVYAAGLAVGPGDNVHVLGSIWDAVTGPEDFLTIKYQQGNRRQ